METSLKNKILQTSYKDSKDSDIDKPAGVKGILRKLRMPTAEDVNEGELISENSVAEILVPENSNETKKPRLKRI